jgi:predicted RNA binding protein YcfA (HicA-like mRNA interferase family)
VKVREAIKLIEQDGWYLHRTRGSHRHFKHWAKPGIVTIAGHPGVDIPKG